MNIKKYFIIVLILIFAFIIRLNNLSTTPVALFGDETDIGYQAYSILKTGKDYSGNFFPIYFQSFFEYRMPLQVYLTVPFTIFGLNEYTVRLPSLIMGILNIFALYLLLKTCLKEKTEQTIIPLISALVLATSPWHIHYSRLAFDVNLMLLLILLGFIFLFKSQKNLNLMPFAVLSFGLSFYAYSTSIIFLILLLPIYFFIYKDKYFPILNKNIDRLIPSIITATIILLPLIFCMFSGEASTRFSGINITKDQLIIDKIIGYRSQDGELGRLFHNKLLEYARAFFGNYLQALSPYFLYIKGDPTVRHSVPDFGLLLFWTFPLLILGLMFSRKLSKLEVFFLSWLFISPISSSLTINGGNQATRLYLMLPALVFFIGKGVVILKQLLNKWLFYLSLILIFIIMVIELTFWFHQYYRHYNYQSWEAFGYGYKQVGEFLKNHSNEYDRVIINNNRTPWITDYLFWTETNPKWFQKNFQGTEYRTDLINNFKGFNFGKTYFGTFIDPQQTLNELTSNDLWITYQTTDEIPGDWDWLKNPPEGVRVLLQVLTPDKQMPYLYIITKEND